MKKLRQFPDIKRDDFLSAVSESYNNSEIARNLGANYVNGTTGREIKYLLEYFDADISHFDIWKCNSDRRKWETILKECPVCKNEFETQKNHPKEKTVCSPGCANTYFRSGKGHPNWKEESENPQAYRSTCFSFHEKKCIICGEENIVAVHHYDHNHKNCSPDNLIPLCPTHHQYVHSRFAYLVEAQIEDFRKKINCA